MTQLTRGGGVGIWVPNTFKHKIRNDLNSINRSFFESLWLEIQAPFKEKLLVNVSYCSNKNLGEFFLEELSSEISSAYSITYNVILFGDYNINFFNEREKELLTEFASNNGLEIVNKNTPTWTNGNRETLIDHCLTTKRQLLSSSYLEVITLHKFSFRHWTLIMKTTKRNFFTEILANLLELILTKKLHPRIGVSCTNKTMQTQLLKNFQLCLKIF